ASVAGRAREETMPMLTFLPNRAEARAPLARPGRPDKPARSVPPARMGRPIVVARSRGRAGLGRIAWSRKLRGRAARPGRYRLIVTATVGSARIASTVT